MTNLGDVMADLAPALRLEMLQAIQDLFPLFMVPVAIAGVIAIIAGVVRTIRGVS